MKTSRCLLVTFVAAACPGCLTVGARVQGGPTLDTTGKVGWEVGVAAGIGYSVSERTSVRSLPHVAVSDRGVALGTSLEVGRIDRRVSWHAGMAAELATSEAEWTRSLYGAALHPLLFHHNSAEGEKFTVTAASTRALAVGVEARAGFAQTETESRGVFALMPVLDWTMTAR